MASRIGSARAGLRILRIVQILAGLAALLARPVEAADAPPLAPRIGMSIPLAVPRGAVSKLILRGWKLEQAVEVRSSAPGVDCKLLGKSSAAVPNGLDAKLVGDTQVECEVTLPADFAGAEFALIVSAANGASQPYSVLISRLDGMLDEQEPNEGLRQARPLGAALVVDGRIQSDRDVDVYELEGAAGERVELEIQARRRGSPLDSLLTLYDRRGRSLAASDDRFGADSQLTVALPATDKYYVVVQDAQDRGGPTFSYRLTLRRQRP